MNMQEKVQLTNLPIAEKSKKCMCSIKFSHSPNDGSGAEEFTEGGVEGFTGQVLVVILGHFVGGPDHFETDQFVPSFFEAGDNVTFYRGSRYCCW